jgi:hypothetical protein
MILLDRGWPTPITAVLLCLSVVAQRPARAAAPEYEGEGVAQIVGGNVVSARRRALKAAQREAVVQAVEAHLPAGHTGPQTQPSVQIHRRFARYLERYRVLTEEQQGRHFHIRIAATLDLGRLRRDLAAALGGSGAPSSGEVRIRLAVRTETRPPAPAINQRLAARVVSRLRWLGFEVAADGAAARVTSVVSIRPAEAVRGVALPSAHASTTISVAPAAAQVTGQGWGVGRRQAEADEAAAIRSVESAMSRLVPVLRSRWPSSLTRSGRHVVRVSGVRSFSQFAAIREACAEKTGGVRSCLPRRFTRGEACFLVTTTAALKTSALAAAFAKHRFEGYALKIKRAGGGAAWLALEAKP